jgi:hypothetical protein
VGQVDERPSLRADPLGSLQRVLDYLRDPHLVGAHGGGEVEGAGVVQLPHLASLATPLPPAGSEGHDGDMTRPVQIVMDAAEPARLAEFWVAALADRGYVVPGPPAGMPDWPAFLSSQGVAEELWDAYSAIEDPTGAQPRIFFQRVPEPKTVKNRVHLDLQAGGGPSVPADEQRRRVAAEVERLEALGARRIAEHTELGTHWVVMADPEGNEFCV